MRMLIRRRYVRRVARMVVGVRSGMVLMLGLRRERLGRGGRCPRPVVRPVAFIGAIHLQGRISSTQPEESHPPSAHDDTKGPDTGMIVSARAPFDHSICGIWKSRAPIRPKRECLSVRLPACPFLRLPLWSGVRERATRGWRCLLVTRDLEYHVANLRETHIYTHTATTTTPSLARIALFLSLSLVNDPKFTGVLLFPEKRVCMCVRARTRGRPRFASPRKEE